MANVKRGNLTVSPQWWQHLRHFGKREFWKGERQAHKAAISAEVDEPVIRTDGGAMTMNEMYGDSSSHEVCQGRGMCLHCGDCVCETPNVADNR